MSRHFWTPENIKKVMKLHSQGSTYDELAVRFSSTRGSISGVISRERKRRREKVFGDEKPQEQDTSFRW